MNEALATTEYDTIPNDTEDATTASFTALTITTVASATSSSSANAIPSSSFPNSAPQAAFAVDPIIGTATIPSSRMKLQGAQRRFLGMSTLPQRAFLWASSLRQHRFVARHRRSALRRSSLTKHLRRDAADTTVGYAPEQSAIAKGYADGWKAAKTFAAYNSSQLGMHRYLCFRDLADTARTGFTGQFVSDALTATDGTILSGDEQYYRNWFSKSR